MSKEWLIAKQGIQHGPYSTEELHGFVRSGWLVKDDLVWKEGMQQWSSAVAVQGLFNDTDAVLTPPSVPHPAHGQVLAKKSQLCGQRSSISATYRERRTAEQRWQSLLIIGVPAFLLFIGARMLLHVEQSKQEKNHNGLGISLNIAASDRAACISEIRRSLHDPSYFDLVEIDGPRDIMARPNVYRCSYRAKNVFGALMLQTVYLQVQNGKAGSIPYLDKAALDSMWGWAGTGMARYGDQIDPHGLMLGAQVDQGFREELESRRQREPIE